MNEVKNVRALWKGILSFGLVTIPVKTYAAVRDFVSPLHQYEVDSLKRIRQLKTVDGKTEVPYDKIGRGLEVNLPEGGQKVVILTDDELKNISIESEKTIDITDFVEPSEIDSRMYEKPYFLVADKGAEKGYNLIFAALLKLGKTGIAKVAVRGREYLMAVSANKNFGLLQMHQLRWAHELVRPNLTGANPNISDEELKLAEMLINARTSSFNPNKYKDYYHDGLQALIREKSETGKVTPKVAKGKVVTSAPDMVELLKESLGVKVVEKKSKKSKSKKVA